MYVLIALTNKFHTSHLHLKQDKQDAEGTKRVIPFHHLKGSGENHSLRWLGPEPLRTEDASVPNTQDRKQ
eukprot:scaffold744_cov370-Prasinococcus_capsulatus_cf.AAC.7